MPYDQSEADFNEAAYGMYLTYELQRWFELQDDLDGIALPPTLQDEADLGYDMSIPRKWGFLYLQFKMPDYLRRSNASEWRIFGEPYFRFKVKTDVTANGCIQRNVLCDLEAEGETVSYAAPAFLTSDELTDYALNDGMYSNSAFPLPSDLGHVPARSNHCFAYTDCRDVRAFSEPGPSVSRGFDELTSRVRGVVGESEPIVLHEFLSRSAVRLVEVIGASSRSDVGPSQSILLASSSVGLMPILVSTE
ncbi:hypothetical protein [Mobilicoccus pelagius]|uniref:Uncharacterized protein n=1 Tax=Mobilicoccus pelagius NBRC 104925 TaxID=1089455 RepID=H5UT81_9MICO|nr:hypothetical protein [Mobilicoccus pelagius]GAB48939.1 hypothetical protein MOPEL_086_00020 [Mobilicoccus pelagius NBRC 104925]